MKAATQVLLTCAFGALLLMMVSRRDGGEPGSQPTQIQGALARARQLAAAQAAAHAEMQTTAQAAPPPPPQHAPRSTYCGDNKCEPDEDCFADCPGVTTPPTCGEEPHSDPGGEAVAWGLTHKTASAAECCERCAAHAADPKNAKKPCNSWVFCYLPQCWSLDTGHKHTFGECWLKWQVNPGRPLYGQRALSPSPLTQCSFTS